MPNDPVIAQAIALWRTHGCGSGPVTATPCAVGGNNRLLLLDNGTSRVVAKAYYRGAHDGAARLDAEWSFLQHALKAGVGNVARPIAADRGALLALFDYVDGRKLVAGEVGEAEVRTAAGFVRAINDVPEALRKLAAETLPRAGDAAFSLREYFTTVERRLRRLDLIHPDTDADRQAADQADELKGLWTDLQANVLGQAEKLGLSLDQEIDPSEKIISPSDFGFHNALLAEGGGLCFIDFEYAGFDDVAKLICDFFLQPEIPVNKKYFALFVSGVAEGITEKQMKRVEMLCPIFALKWCCIMLNFFIFDRAGRIRHANPGCDIATQKAKQLAKVRLALQELRCQTWRTSISFP